MIEKDLLIENIEGNIIQQDSKALKFLNMQNKIDEMTELKNSVKQQEKMILDNDELSNKLDEKIADMSLKEVSVLTDEQVENIFTIDGEIVNLDSAVCTDKDRSLKFKRDFLIYKKTMMESFKEIDKTMDTFQKEIDQDFEEFQKVIDEYGDVSTYLYEDINRRYESASSEELKNKYKTMLDNFDWAFNFDQIYEYHKNTGLTNPLNDYERLADGVYARYMKTIKRLKLKNVDLTIFDDLEIKYLPEKYHKYPNLFLFLVIRFYGYRKDSATSISDGVFLSQLHVNLKKLVRNKFLQEGQREQFLLNIQRVLDLFY